MNALVSLTCCCGIMAGVRADTAPALPAPEAIVFQTDDGLSFDALLHRPDPAADRGVGVMLIGGGLVMNIDWMIPGQYTISGEPTLDARTIAEALSHAGFTVFQWSSIHRDDPQYKTNPIMAQGQPFPATVVHTRAALSTFRSRDVVPPDRIVLLGHSLGGVRAAITADLDGPVAGLVLLAPSEQLRLGARSNELHLSAAEAMMTLDVDEDEKISNEEFDARADALYEPALEAANFGDVDFNGDGVLAEWEIAGKIGLHNRRTHNDIIKQRPTLPGGLPFPEDVYPRLDAPVLVLYGSEDAMLLPMYAPCLVDLARCEAIADFTVRVLPGLGHQMGPESDEKFGPIDEDVIEQVVQWMKARFPERR